MDRVDAVLMFKKTIIALFILIFLLLAIGFIGTYQTNVYVPAMSPFTVVVPPGADLGVYIYSMSNYGIISIAPYSYGYIIILKNRNKLVDMWQ